MDILAKARQHQVTTTTAQPYCRPIEGEMWQLYQVTPQAKEIHTDCSSGKQIQTALDSQLLYHVFGGPLQKYWEDHNVISKVMSYDCTALGLARAKKSHQR
eukprot:14757790-Ditylum_brightwellii.AAC.1